MTAQVTPAGSHNHGEIVMKKTSITGLAAIIPAIALSSVVEAKTVLSAKERCFQVGQVIEGAKNWTLKIKPQQALTDKPVAVIEAVGLSHGVTTTNPPENSMVQMAGAASYVTPGYGEEPYNTVRIALVGNTYSSHADGSRIVSWNVSLILDPEIKGKIPDGRLVGIKTYTPITTGPDVEPSTQAQVNDSVTEISCKGF